MNFPAAFGYDPRFNTGQKAPLDVFKRETKSFYRYLQKKWGKPGFYCFSVEISGTPPHTLEKQGFRA